MNSFSKLLLFAFLIMQNAYSQNNYYTTWLSADSNHLPQNSVKAIVPDKYGFLWLSTESGLVRYDGQNFKNYNLDNIKGLSSNRMFFFSGNIEKDSIFISNEKFQTLLIHKTTVKKINKPINQPHSPSPPGLYYAQKKHSFTITTGTKRFLIGNDSIKSYDNTKLLSQFKYTLKDSSQFFFSSGKLYILGDTPNEYISLSDNAIKSYKFNPGFKEKCKIYSNTQTEQCFLYSNKKLFYIKEENGKIVTQLIFENFDLPQNNIVSIYYDTVNEILYLGSSNRGLLRVMNTNFRSNSTEYYHSNGTDDVYYALTEYTKNSILASTGEIFRPNGTTDIINIGKYSDKYMLLIDANGDVWTKYGSVLYRFSKKSGFKSFKEWQFRNSLTVLFKDKDGKIWVGMFNDRGKKGGFLYTITPSETSPKPQLFLKTNFAPCVLKRIDNNTLLAGSWKGLHKISLKDKVVTNITGIPNVQVRSIYSKNPNEIWICTYGKGIYLYKNNTITSFPLDKDQLLLTAHCIIEDKTGLLWITTNKGLFTVLKQDLLDYTEKKLEKIYYHAYYKNSGFKNNEFNGGCNSCGVYLNNETVFFPSMNGIVYFNPEKIKKRMPKSDIYIDEINVDNNVFYASDTLIIDRNFERISFSITSPYFGNLYNQNMEIKLEGPIIQDWMPVSENKASFSTLPPGNYTLNIRKLSGFGSKYIYKDFKFTIAHAFWQTPWFIVAAILLLLLLLYFIYKLRIKYIKYKNIQLEKQIVLKTEQLQNTIITLRKTKDDLNLQIINHKNLIKTITHDIKSPLKFMAITGRFLYNNFDKQETSLKDDILAMYTSSSQLYHFIDNFLEYSKETDINNNESPPYSLHDLVNEKSAFFKNIATASKSIIINDVPRDLFLTLNRHLLSIILHNLLDNAIKSTFDGTIVFQSYNSDKIVHISIKDTGNGMSEETIRYYKDLKNSDDQKHTGMGLPMIIELLAIMEGTMDITSSKNIGTTITLSFTLKD